MKTSALPLFLESSLSLIGFVLFIILIGNTLPNPEGNSSKTSSSPVHKNVLVTTIPNQR